MNLHPPFSSLPFAFLLTLCVLEFVQLFKVRPTLEAASRVLAVCAGLGVVAAFISGYGAEDDATRMFHIAEEVIARHHNYGRLLLFAMVPCVALKFLASWAKFNREIFRVAYLVTLLLCFGLGLYTGWLGGELVFKHGAGVCVPNAAPHELHCSRQGDLSGVQPTTRLPEHWNTESVAGSA